MGMEGKGKFYATVGKFRYKSSTAPLNRHENAVPGCQHILEMPEMAERLSLIKLDEPMAITSGSQAWNVHTKTQEIGAVRGWRWRALASPWWSAQKPGANAGELIGDNVNRGASSRPLNNHCTEDWCPEQTVAVLAAVVRSTVGNIPPSVWRYSSISPLGQQQL